MDFKWDMRAGETCEETIMLRIHSLSDYVAGC